MNKYTIITDDNISATDGYSKIGTFPLQPHEKENYSFPSNNENIILDVYWISANGLVGQYAKFGCALLNSTTMKVYLMSTTQASKLINNPIAYKRTSDGFDLYIKSNASIYAYQSVKCFVTTINSRFIPLSGNPIEDITDLSATYPSITDSLLNVDNSTLTNSSITNIINGNKFIGEASSTTLAIPNYTASKRYIINFSNIKSGTYKAVDVLVYSGNVTLKYPHDDSALSVSNSDGTLTITGLEWYSYLYYEIKQV